MLSVATLFSGIGAPEQALRNLGIEHRTILACDIDKNAQRTYFANFSSDYFFDDIRKIPADKFKDAIDLLVFGAPCQPYSSAGKKKGIADDRFDLFVHAVKLMLEWKPRMFIAENVEGLLTIGGNAFTEVKRLMKTEYIIKYDVLNSMDYGVPQNRRRVYIIGIRKDIKKEFSFPSKKKMKPLVKIFDKKVDRRFYCTKEFLSKEKVQKTLDKYNKDHFHCLTNAVARNGSSREYINYVAAVFHATGQKRKPTPRECARLHGFPESFILPDTVCITAQYRQFGSTMTVPLIEGIIKNLYGG